ncbi:expressed unknown protein [Seminavis robusta]|uniref:Transmembrane protein n=1 Tax=Seminavis robusta TaxID=568900 RepID=A0A9N8HCE1_9STRA|nr:expressed unknown protein [Seminavis robusta]|eukprot:Sro405_g136120.1 n/a (325) ;mRNA; f:28857-29831
MDNITAAIALPTAAEAMASAPVYDIYSVQFPPWWCFNFFLMIWCFGRVVEHLLAKTSMLNIGTKYKVLPWDKQRNVVVYVLQTIITTLAFVLQILGGIDIVFQRKDTTTEVRYSFMIVMAQLVFVLYTWELIYRLKIGMPLLIHHIMTCLMTQLLAAALVDTFDVEYARLATMLSFYATTEQTSFVALFCYRLDLFSKETQHSWFTVAAIQSIVVKSSIAIFSLVYFCVVFFVRKEADDQPTNWKWFWKICFIPLVLALFAAQLYTSQILWQLRNKCSVEVRKSIVSSKKIDDDALNNGTDTNCREDSENDDISVRVELFTIDV